MNRRAKGQLIRDDELKPKTVSLAKHVSGDESHFNIISFLKIQ
jgi:hypothetical protein